MKFYLPLFLSILALSISVLGLFLSLNKKNEIAFCILMLALFITFLALALNRLENRKGGMKTKEGFPLAWSPRSIFFEIIDEGRDSYIELRLDKNMDGTLKVDEEIKMGGRLLPGDREAAESYSNDVVLNLKWKIEDMRNAGLRGNCEAVSLFKPSLHCKFSSGRISPEAMKREGALSTENLIAAIIRLLPHP